MSPVQLLTSLAVIIAVTAMLLFLIEGHVDPVRLASTSMIAFVGATVVRFLPGTRGAR